MKFGKSPQCCYIYIVTMLPGKCVKIRTVQRTEIQFVTFIRARHEYSLESDGFLDIEFIQ